MSVQLFETNSIEDGVINVRREVVAVQVPESIVEELVMGTQA
jgi:hypothetical protein